MGVQPVLSAAALQSNCLPALLVCAHGTIQMVMAPVGQLMIAWRDKDRLRQRVCNTDFSLLALHMSA